MSSSTAINTSMTPYEWAMLLALSVLWGGSFFFVEVAIRELPTFTVVVCRVVLAALTLLAVMRFMGLKMPKDARIWGAFFGMGVLNNVIPFTLIVWGQMHIASGVASILNATTPLFTVIVAHYMTSDEKMTPAKFLGVILGMIGVAIMIGGDALGALGLNVTAQLAILAAAISYAFAGIFGRRFKALNVNPIATATGQVTASSMMLVPLMLLIDQPWALPVPGIATLTSLAGLAVLSTSLAYILYFRILSTAGATNLLLVTFLIPVSAILLGVLVLGEVLQPKHYLGMALIGLGLAAIDGRLWLMARGGSGKHGAVAAERPDIND